jgi:preprotein translocase subunit SecD
VTGQWQVQLKFTGAGTDKFAKVTTRLAAIDKTQPRNRFGIVLDDLVISAPTTNEPIVAGDAQISGNFTQTTANNLSNQLKFGALPISFRVDTQQQISALLGKEQLERGLLAGLIGLILVVLYSIAQYRMLGLVTVASLAIAGGLTYGTVALLGWTQGYRLSLPGVTGLIVAIGITADSFIVYFERVRDEVREGRGLLAAVEVGWQRARRTILASDSISFLAALVLYVLAVGSVQGFAFTLGLTTLIDIVVVFLFTKPIVTLLARTKFFGQGHSWSGFDAAHLGRDVRYAGRGRVRTESADTANRQTIAQRRAAAAAEAEDGAEHRNGSEIAEAGAGRAAGARRES